MHLAGPRATDLAIRERAVEPGLVGRTDTLWNSPDPLFIKLHLERHHAPARHRVLPLRGLSRTTHGFQGQNDLWVRPLHQGENAPSRRCC